MMKGLIAEAPGESIEIPKKRKAPFPGLLYALRARNETRTRDPNLGKVVLYQLSYSRMKSDPSIVVQKYVNNSFPSSRIEKKEKKAVL